MKRQNAAKLKNRRGSAILIALLMVTVLATIAFSVGQITYAEIKMAAGIEDASIAYSAAEAGIEDGLLRWRYDHNIESPADATADSINVNRVDLSDANGGSVSNNVDPNTPITNADHAHYDLKISYRQKMVGNFGNFMDAARDISKDTILKQDEVLELTGFKNNFTLQFKYERTSNPPPQTCYTQVKIIHQVGESNVNIYDCNDNGSTGKDIIVQAGDTIKIKPWNTEIRYALRDKDNVESIDIGETLIESAGHYGSVKRKLVARINRKNGQIIGIYDFVLYSGQGNITSQ